VNRSGYILFREKWLEKGNGLGGMMYSIEYTIRRKKKGNEMKEKK
jgi:hypothetical protein